MNQKERIGRLAAPMHLSCYIVLHVLGSGLLYGLFAAYLSDVVYLYIPTQAVGVVHMTLRRFFLLHLVTLAGIVCTLPDERTCLRVAKNVLAPYGLLFAVALFPKWSLAIWFFVSLGVVYTILTLAQAAVYPLSTTPRSHRLALRAILFATSSMNVLCGCLAGVLLFCLAAAATPAANIVDPFAATPDGANTSVSAAPVSAPAEEKMELTEEKVLHLLQPDVRGSMTGEELLALCQAIANLEAKYLGIVTPNTVSFETLPETTLGRYSHKLHAIELNRSYVHEATAEELLNTILHECHHSYAYHLLEAVNSVPPEYRNLMALREATIFGVAIEEYVSGDEDYEAYYYSPLELAARNHASRRVHMYQLSAENEARA